jgi:hypothetical protein
LVYDEEPFVPPTADMATKKPLCVATVCNSKFLLDLGCGKVRFGLGVQHEEKVIDAGGRD